MRLKMALMVMFLAGPVAAQHMDHGHAAHGGAGVDSGPVETGQAAFAAIQEIVEYLRADPKTDWSKVDIDALRAHLVDMDNVTMRAEVKPQPIEGGMAFLVSSEDPEVIGSIQRMVLAHAQVMNGVDGLQMRAVERPYGAMLGVEGDADRINGLGFFGIMATGMHHQAHHLAIAQGGHPHQ
ncbi:MAG: hypothetical protein ACRBBS_10125 [Thalassovita sp.]